MPSHKRRPRAATCFVEQALGGGCYELFTDTFAQTIKRLNEMDEMSRTVRSTNRQARTRAKMLRGDGQRRALGSMP